MPLPRVEDWATPQPDDRASESDRTTCQLVLTATLEKFVLEEELPVLVNAAHDPRDKYEGGLRIA